MVCIFAHLCKSFDLSYCIAKIVCLDCLCVCVESAILVCLRMVFSDLSTCSTICICSGCLAHCVVVTIDTHTCCVTDRWTQ